ncbi:MAG: formylglycine-generating enzyme family protein, partial [Planctomycetes bacterium]|nr:formylglycine-generating enzyme family protein [Planctomycetota bacterium]
MSQSTLSAAAIWAAAREAADVIVNLPALAGGGAPIELFLRHVPATGPRGFRMGARGEFADEEPIHRVVIDHDFFLGTFVVTQEQWAAVWPGIDAERWYPDRPPWGKPPGASPSYHSPASQGADTSRRPVEQVSWYDALAFCDWLSRNGTFAAGKEPPAGYLFCLPTEPEWEFACRGGGSGTGSDTEYWNGDGEAALGRVGWYDANSSSRTHDVTEPVDPEAPEQHPLGLFGIHGNVLEWCHDEWGEARYRRHVDGDSDSEAARHRWQILSALLSAGPTALGEELLPRDRYRVIRGGSWLGTAGRCRSACRLWYGPVDRSLSRGFRVCLVRGPGSL